MKKTTSKFFLLIFVLAVLIFGVANASADDNIQFTVDKAVVDAGDSFSVTYKILNTKIKIQDASWVGRTREGYAMGGFSCNLTLFQERESIVSYYPPEDGYWWLEVLYQDERGLFYKAKSNEVETNGNIIEVVEKGIYADPEVEDLYHLAEVGDEITVQYKIKSKNDNIRVEVTWSASYDGSGSVILDKKEFYGKEGSFSYTPNQKCDMIYTIWAYNNEDVYAAYDRGGLLINVFDEHRLEKHERVEPTSNGSEYYWKCTICRRLFSDENGINNLTGWQEIDDKWYYFDPESGVMQTGWVKDGIWYYMESSGELCEIIGWRFIDDSWYYFDGSGASITGWIEDDDVWYYADTSGAMVIGWQSIGGTWYYFNASGAMATGWVFDDGSRYFLNESGAMVTGWLEDNDDWYYFGDSGCMHSGWLNLGDYWFMFNSNGKMMVGWYNSGSCWYYFDNSGLMATGWKEINGQWEMFDEKTGEWLYTWDGN